MGGVVFLLVFLYYTCYSPFFFLFSLYFAISHPAHAPSSVFHVASVMKTGRNPFGDPYTPPASISRSGVNGAVTKVSARYEMLRIGANRMPSGDGPSRAPSVVMVSIISAPLNMYFFFLLFMFLLLYRYQYPLLYLSL